MRTVSSFYPVWILPTICWVMFVMQVHLVTSNAVLANEDNLPSEPNGRNGTQRLLFDALFGISSSSSSSNGNSGSNANSDDDDDDGGQVAKNCSCTDCGIANPEIRIVGGRPTGLNRYPWIARLVYDGQFHCGGTLLNGDFVLTAAHCVRKLKRSRIRVFLGDHDQYQTTETPAIMRTVTSIIRHRNFDINSYNHDIALLKLRKSVPFTKRVRPVCLPQTPSVDISGRVGTVVGWGRTSEGGALPAIVHEVQVPILSMEQCRQTKYRGTRITSNMVCAGNAQGGAKDSCQGDSGGPLLVPTGGDKHEIVGIVSWGVGCGRPGYPGVYTRVARYLDWVKRNMKGTCLC